MSAYYNEFEPYAAEWLRNLIKAGHIADGEVDERSIADVKPEDLKGFTQCHFFAGIGGWSYAARLAGWADGKARRVEPTIRLLAHGVPARVGKLRAFGNAIVPQVAAQVIAAYVESCD